jgi:hypothetical protein
LWEITTNPATAGTIVSGIDYLTQPAAGTVRIEAHKSGRRSWLLMQPRGNNENWFYGCQVTLGNAGHVFRSRIRTHIKVSGGLINAGNCHFAICRNDADKPNFSAGLPGYHMLGGWNASAANQMNIRYALRSNVAGAVTVTTGPDLDQVAGGADVEIAFVLRAGTSTWDLWLRTPSISYHVGAADFSSSSLGNGNTVWVGWNFTGQDSDKPSAGIVGADFWRQEDSNTGFIP